MLFALLVLVGGDIFRHWALLRRRFRIQPGTDARLRQQFLFAKSVQSTLFFIQPLGQHLPIMRGGTGLPFGFQGWHQLHHVGGIVLIDARATLIDQQHLFPMREEPDGGMAHRDLFEMRFTAAQSVDEAARAPRR